MNCTLSINPADREKFKEVVEIFNKMKNSNMQITEAEHGFEVEFDQVQQLFTLGRFFQPYKPADKTGTFHVNFNNDYLNKI